MTHLLHKIADMQITIEALRRCEQSLRTELASARLALKQSASRSYDSSTNLFEPNAAARYLDMHPNQNG